MSDFADLILSNGVIRTFDPALPLAEAVAVHNGRILALGTSNQISAYRRPGTTFIDLKGRCLLPGFIDAHQHQLYMGLSFEQVDASAESVSNIEQIVDRFAERAAQAPEGSWLEGRGYQDMCLAEQRDPNRYDLDRASANHALYLTRVCGHTMVLNSLALEYAHITASTPEPPGGTIERNPETGEPTGVLRETAMQLVRRVIPTPSDETLNAAILKAARHNLRRGITTVWEPSIEPPHLRMYKLLAANGELPIRVLMAHKKILRSGEDVPIPERFTGEWLSLVAIKLFQDGGFGSATAALSNPYANPPDTRGLLILSQHQLNEYAKEIHDAGLRISVHAIGDAAILSVLEAIEYAIGNALGRHYRHRIEHCGLPLPPIPQRIKSLGIVPVLQPPFIWFEGDVYTGRVGPQRSRWLYPVKTLIEAGLTVAASSDGPVVPDVNPLLGVYAAVTRQSKSGNAINAEEAVDLETAIALYTSQAAFACGEEDLKGTISPGKMADFVVLENDPFAVQIDDLPDIPIDMTIVNGIIHST